MNSTKALRRVADEFSEAVPKVDSNAEHHRWKPGIGPFEEDEQVRMLVEALQTVSVSA